jgi:hypothetical protein
MANETWKDIKGYEGYYQINSIGTVRSLNRRVWNGKGYVLLKGKIINSGIDSHGYPLARLSKEGKSKTFKIHQLVAQAFLNHKIDGYSMVVDHINNNKEDNRVENLQVVSQRLNASKDRKTKYTGVTKHGDKWRARIRIEGKNKHLGLFNTPEEASNKYQEILKTL